MTKPTIAITIGDLAGIGPEVTAKALGIIFGSLHSSILLIGSKKQVIKSFQKFAPYLLSQIEFIKKIEKQKSKIALLDIFKSPDIKLGEVSKTSGLLSFNYVDTAIQLAMQKKVDAIVTAPINKESWNKANIEFKGHTRMLAKLSKTSNYAMAFHSSKLCIILETIHIPLAKVASTISSESIFHKIILGNNFMKNLGKKNPKIAVCGLNPHAGEGGLLGPEEIKIITPAIEKAKTLSVNVFGPFPSDALFYKAYQDKEYDLIVTMYHDQGLGPLKMVDFQGAVNVTLGLPFTRTSADHGTAFDIAGKGIADAGSMCEAIKLAERLI